MQESYEVLSQTYQVPFGTTKYNRANHQKWPMGLEPFFIIETCTNCQDHLWCTRHKVGQYDAKALDVKTKIEMAVPQLQRNNKYDSTSPIQVNSFNQNILNSDAVWVSSGEIRQWTAAPYLAEMGNRAYWKGISTDGVTYENYATPRGAFEVYFMGVRLYSKLATNQWPNSTLLAHKCARIYQDYINGEDISGYEFQHISRKMQEEAASTGMSDFRMKRAQTAETGLRSGSKRKATSRGRTNKKTPKRNIFNASAASPQRAQTANAGRKTRAMNQSSQEEFPPKPENAFQVNNYTEQIDMMAPENEAIVQGSDVAASGVREAAAAPLEAEEVPVPAQEVEAPLESQHDAYEDAFDAPEIEAVARMQDARENTNGSTSTTQRAAIAEEYVGSLADAAFPVKQMRKLNLNIVVCQTETAVRDQKQLSKYLEGWSDILSTFGAFDKVDIVQFPEMAFTDYVWKDAEEIKPLSEEAGKGPIFNFLSTEAIRLGCYVSAGYTEFCRYDSAVYSSMYVVGRAGELLVNHRKTSLFVPERQWAKPSSADMQTLIMKNTEGVEFKTGFAICKEFALPKTHKFWNDQKLDVLLVPTCVATQFNDSNGNPGAYSGPMSFQKTMAPMNKDWLVLWVNHAGEEENNLDQLKEPDHYQPTNELYASKTITYAGQSGVIRNSNGQTEVTKRLQPQIQEAAVFVETSIEI